MKKVGKMFLWFLVIFIGLTWVLGFVVAPERNPAQRNKETIISQELDKVLKVSCFDCHSNETVWPWYTSVPPMSALVNFDVAKGRKVLNFSEWDTMNYEQRSEILEHSIQAMEGGFMPFPPYLIMHKDAKISPETLEQLKEAIDAIGYSEDVGDEPQE